MSDKIILSGHTKLSDLLCEYPWLKETLAGVSNKLKIGIGITL